MIGGIVARSLAHGNQVGTIGRPMFMQKISRLRVSAASLVLLAIVTSCGADSQSIDALDGETVTPAEVETGWGPLAVIGGNRSGDQALISGTLRIADDCVLLDERGDMVLLVWPEEETEWEPVTGSVRYRAGDGSVAVLGEGEVVSFGGGGSSELEDGTMAEDFVSSVTWVSQPADHCIVGTRWFVGELADVGQSGQEEEPQSATTDAAGSASAQANDEQTPAWPSTEVGPATECVYQYPNDLADQPIAFDGTVLSISRGEYIDEAAAIPVDLVIQVNEVFRGDLGPTVTMHTFDFSTPDQTEAWDPTGIRILAAAGESLDVMACGFTRPYTTEEADAWADAFTQ